MFQRQQTNFAYFYHRRLFAFEIKEAKIYPGKEEEKRPKEQVWRAII